MNVVISDPGYDHEHSHHPDVTRTLVRAFRDHDVTVLASQYCRSAADVVSPNSGARVIPYFLTPAYPQDVESLDVKSHFDLASSFELELCEAMHTGLIKDGSVFVMHTFHAFHVLGLGRALYRDRGASISKIYLSMMFDPGVIVTSEDEDAVYETIDGRRYQKYRMAFKCLKAVASRRAVPLLLDTSCESYRCSYRAVVESGAVGVHPIVTGAKADTVDSGSISNRVVLYLGGPKEGKGFRFAISVAEELVGSDCDVEVFFHFNREFPGADCYASEVARLKSMEHCGKKIRVFEGNLPSSEYDSIIAESAILCLLYDPGEYYFKTSGVLWDGLRRQGLKWVVTKNTWMEHELTSLGLPCKVVEYGQVGAAVEAIKELVENERFSPSLSRSERYLSFLLSDYGSHVRDRVSIGEDDASGAPILAPSSTHRERKLLLIRTKYGHFGKWSGPAGFVSHLHPEFDRVDVLEIELGEERVREISVETLRGNWSSMQRILRSYQLNSLVAEHKIVSCDFSEYDVIHFLDGEHSGVLTALYALQIKGLKENSWPKLVATFHQPVSVLQDIVVDSGFLDGFDAIHVLSPCQIPYFEGRSTAKVVCVPHGIPREMIDASSRRYPHSNKAQLTACSVNVPERFVLTVGSWLRDFDLLLQTAEILVKDDVQFVIVSKGLKLERSLPSNVHILNEGIDDEDFQAIYARASLLFLPLLDGAANNAILEAMAHGLPIVATDIPATRYYTQGHAHFCIKSADSYAEAIKEVMAEGVRFNQSLATRANELVWDIVADEMLDNIYRTH